MLEENIMINMKKTELTLKDASALSGISLKTLEMAVNRNVLPAIKKKVIIQVSAQVRVIDRHVVNLNDLLDYIYARRLRGGKRGKYKKKEKQQGELLL
jgi:hypothetical protein